MDFDNYDEGSYCENCDTTSGSDDYQIIPLDRWHELWACPNCGYADPKVMMSDEFYDTAFYLLAPADDEFVSPEYVYLPTYEG